MLTQSSTKRWHLLLYLEFFEIILSIYGTTRSATSVNKFHAKTLRTFESFISHISRGCFMWSYLSAPFDLASLINSFLVNIGAKSKLILLVLKMMELAANWKSTDTLRTVRRVH